MAREIAPGVEHLSVSSIGTYLKCPIKWKNRYLERRYEPASGPLVQGRVVHEAVEVNYRQKIASREDMPLEEVTDAYADAWEVELEEASDPGIEWGADKPAQWKDQGAELVKLHHREVAPVMLPLAVEREWRLDYADGLSLIGRIDLESRTDPQSDQGSVVCDTKVRGRRLSAADAAVEMQPDAYLAARRAEGDPSPRLDYHVLTRTKTPGAEIVTAERSEGALDAFLAKVQAVADDIEWRAENDHWTGAAPGSWWCSEKFCGYFDTCAWGGLFAKRAAQAGRAAA